MNGRLSINNAAASRPRDQQSAAVSPSVGPPLEVATYPTDSFNMGWRAKFRADSAYLQSLAASWQQGLQIAFANLPKFDWEQT
jgi:predicted proteasome-type protease